MNLEWERFITSHWKPRINICVFLSGIVLSILIIVITTYSPSFKIVKYHLPDNHYLQIREEFSVLDNNFKVKMEETEAEEQHRSKCCDVSWSKV